MLWCFLGFFFFKQKTAYEMRISDWNSDLCSSDLQPVLVETASGLSGAVKPGYHLGVHVHHLAFAIDSQTGTRVMHVGRRPRRVKRDRKSVVSGKSVSVRVDLGGRRIIKKKNNKIYRACTRVEINKYTQNNN